MSYEQGRPWRLSHQLICRTSTRSVRAGCTPPSRISRKWDANYYSHVVGGDTLQKRSTLAACSPAATRSSTRSATRWSTDRGLRTDEHGGSMMGYKAHLLRFPDQHLSVIETCNLGSINPEPSRASR